MSSKNYQQSMHLDASLLLDEVGAVATNDFRDALETHLKQYLDSLIG